MNNIKQLFLNLATVLALSATNVQAADVDKTLPWTEGGKVKISITSGQIEIRGWNKNEVKLTGDYSGESDRLIFKESGSNIKLELRDEGGSWWGGHSNGSVDFTLYTPFESDIDIDGTSLEIEIDDIQGSIDASSISGRVKVSSETKRADIETVSGDIDIDKANGKMRLRTVSGDINAQVSAINFDAKTVSGDIDSRIGNTEYASLLSVSGDIDVELTLANDGRVDGQTVSGNLELSFENSRVNADFELNTGPGGDISNKLSNDRPDDNDHWGQKLNFTVGSGDATVDLETMSGSIRLR